MKKGSRNSAFTILLKEMSTKFEAYYETEIHHDHFEKRKSAQFFVVQRLNEYNTVFKWACKMRVASSPLV